MDDASCVHYAQTYLLCECICSQSVLEYSADATRWALADAGDGMDDANFETTTANAAILRMTKELVFIEESLSEQSGGYSCTFKSD